MSDPKERPILFRPDLVRDILDNIKTQTRRAVKGEALKWLEDTKFTPEFVADPENGLCPYGKPGDILWVRETWSPDGRAFYPFKKITYKADNEIHDFELEDGCIVLGKERYPFKWRPSIHMKKADSRIGLLITSVRIEKLSQISDADARSEGRFMDARDFLSGAWAKEQFQKNPDPWVWVIGFQRV